MYRTESGIRVLRGAEQRLLAESFRLIADDLCLGEYPYDIPIIENLTHNQRIAVYHRAVSALFLETEPPPELTAVLEAAVASAYLLIRARISDLLEAKAQKINDPEMAKWPPWRELANAVGREMGLEETCELDEMDCMEWDLLLENIEYGVLWDSDWEMAEHLDLDPEKARRVKSNLGIDEDYFIAIPPDPNDDEAKRLLRELVVLLDDALSDS